MRVGVYLAHPSQYFVLKNIKNQLQKNGHEIRIYIKTKDILEQILKDNNEEYLNIYPQTKKNNILSLIKSVLIKNIRLYKHLKNEKIDIVISAASDISQATYLKRIPSIIFNDDDAHIIPKSSIFGWPLSSVVLVPKTCSMGKWESKSIKVNAYQKTTYMHPTYFTPAKDVLLKYKLDNKPFFIIRSVSLTAHHDDNITGLGNKEVNQIVQLLIKNGKVLISSERPLSKELEPYRIKIDVSDMHSLLYYSDLLIADSQSMCHEAALLGVPSIRYNDFVGRIGVLNDLEKRGLAIGINPPNFNLVINRIKEILNDNNFKQKLRNKSKELVKSQIDFTAFSVWFIENYPHSALIMKENPDYQYRFK